MIEKELCGIIIEKYYNDIFLFCFSKLHNSSAAEDCTQETFLTFLGKRNRLLYSDRILGWLLKTAEKKIMEYKRKNTNNHIDINDYADIIQDNNLNADSPILSIYEHLPHNEASLLIAFICCKNKEEKEKLASKNEMTLIALQCKVSRIKKKLYKSLNGNSLED